MRCCIAIARAPNQLEKDLPLLIDGREVSADQRFETSVCIIGAGAAGISIAREFIDNGVDVCLVESGGWQVDADTQQLASGENVGQTYFNLETTRLRVFGGTTTHWSGWCRPLDPIDFEERSWIPESGWPLTRSDLDPFYHRAQPICELGPFAYLPEELPLPAEQQWPLGDSKIVNRLIQFSPPTRFGDTYRAELLGAQNIDVFFHSNVLRINTTDDGERASHVDVSSIGGAEFTIHARHFVIATGGLENARLLLLSDAVHQNGLGNSNDTVGRYFMNHLFVQSGAIVASSADQGDEFYTARSEIDTDDGRSLQVRGFMSFTPEAQREQGLVNVSFNISRSDISSVFLKEEEDDRWYSGVGRVIGNFDELARGSYHKVKAQVSDSGRPPIYEIINLTEQAPNASSRVTLDSTLDSLGQRRMRLKWQLTELDLWSIERAHRLLGAELARTGIGRVVTPLEAEEGWPAAYVGDWHHMGTTRMHDDPGKGVVDSDCALHDVPNVFVAGSSVFPTAGYANPTLTIVALALRLADHLKQLQRRGA